MRCTNFTKITAVFVFLTAFTAKVGFSQSKVKMLDKYMVQVQKDNHPPFPTALLQDSKQHMNLLKQLDSYKKDTIAHVRAKTFYVAKRIGNKSTNSEIKRATIDLLIRGLKDNDNSIRGQVIQALMQFELAHFSEDAKRKVLSGLETGVPHLEELLKLIGFLQVEGATHALQSMDNSKLSKEEQWSLLLALARLGDDNSIEEIAHRVESIPANDDVAEVLVPDLIYTRQVPLIAFVISILNSDKTDCTTTDPDSDQKMLCGYRVLEYLAPVVIDFPITIGSSGDLLTEDYQQALTTARIWFKSNSNYKLRNTIF